MLTLRPITPQDDKFLYRVYASTREEELAPLDWSEAQKSAFLRMQFNAQTKYYSENYPSAQFQIILSDAAPSGRLYVLRGEKEIRVIDIALLPAYRNQGFGSKLLQDLLTEGQTRGLPVTIHVERFNPALHLYTRLGFRQVQDEGIYFLMEWTPHAG